MEAYFMRYDNRSIWSLNKEAKTKLSHSYLYQFQTDSKDLHPE